MQLLDNIKALADRLTKPKAPQVTYKRNVFKQEYKILTGTYRKAIILDHILFNNNLTDWVTKSARQLTEELCFDCAPKTVARDLRELAADGLLLSRKHPNPWKKSMQWQANAPLIHERLQTILAPALSHEESQCPIEETQCPSEAPQMSTQKQKQFNAVKKQTTREHAVALPPAEIEDLAIANKDLLDRMTAEVKPLSLKPAIALISKFGPEAVKNQLNWLPARNPKNPAGMLTKALTEDWAAPAAMIEAQQASEARAQNATQESQVQGLISSITAGQMFRIGETVLRYVKAVGSSVIVALDEQETILPKARMSEAVLV